MSAQRFRKRPVVIEAMQYRPDIPNCQDIARFLGYPHPTSFCGDIEPHDTPWMVNTLEGDMQAAPGDWIIRGVKGEFYPCKPDIFEATYEPVDSAGSGGAAAPPQPAGDGQ